MFNNITEENAERLIEIHKEMADLVYEFKNICRNSMTRGQYDQFRYRTLTHLEPGLSNDTDWVTAYSSIDSMEKVAENALQWGNWDEKGKEELEIG